MRFRKRTGKIEDREITPVFKKVFRSILGVHVFIRLKENVNNRKVNFKESGTLTGLYE